MKIKKQFLCLIGAFIFLVTGTEALAAKVGQVIVPRANVYLYPQAASNVISTLNRGDSVTVSNLPTEGFYKVRLSNGDIGWISGNDILAGDGSGGASTIPTPRKKRKTSPTYADSDEDDETPSRPSNDDSFRLILDYGFSITSLNTGSLNENYASVLGTSMSGLNLNKSFGVDAQFRINQKLFWVVRLETYSADSGVVQISSTGPTTQETTVSEIPLEVGLMWSPISTHKFRFGLGAFLGATISAKTTIVYNNAAQVETVNYGSNEICGELASQFSFGVLGDLLGIILEADYRYDQTGKVPSSNEINPPTIVPGFTINYSGFVARLGLEIRL